MKFHKRMATVAIVAVWTGHEARILREALRMTVRGFAEYLGVAVRTVAKWEAKRQAITPLPVMQAALDTALAQAPDDQRARFHLMCSEGQDSKLKRPQTAEDRVADHVRQRPSIISNGHDPSILGVVKAEGADTNRREVLGALLSLLEAIASRPTDGFRETLTRVTGHEVGPVDSSLVSSHEHLFSSLAASYRTTDPAVLLPVAAGYADSVLSLLDRPMAPSQRNRLTAVGIGAHTEVGLAAFNAGRWASGYQALAVALSLARELGDDGLHAQALGATSYLFSSALRGGTGGDPARAVALLDHALAIVPKSDGLVRGWLAGWRADQMAALGDSEAALGDIDLANRALVNTASPHGLVHVDGCAYNVAGHLDGVRGQVDAILGHDDEAERTIGEALQTPGGPRQRIIVLVRLAAARMEAHDPDGTVAALTQAHQLAQEAGYRMGSQRVQGVRARFNIRWSELPCVIQLDEHLRQPAS